MKKKWIVLSAIAIAISLGSLSAISQSRQKRQDLHARWRIELNKDKSSRNQFSQLSRNFQSDYFNRDFPAFFHSTASNKRVRADTSCEFAKETESRIFYECVARANTINTIKFNRLEAWIYRISIPGYQPNDSRMFVRLTSIHDAQSKAEQHDFVDPINHPEEGSPEIQSISVPATSISTDHNYKNQRVFSFKDNGAGEVLGSNNMVVFNTLLAGFASTLLLAITLKNQRGRLASISIIFLSLTLIELTSAKVFHNPYPRNLLLEKWRLADVIDNVLLGLNYQEWTKGLSGKELVKSVWNKANLNSQAGTSFQMIQGIDPKQDGLLFSQSCKVKSAQNIDLLVVGASVAEGWHASHIEKTLWSRLSHDINKNSNELICVGVKARAGIHSNTELEFVTEFLEQAKPRAIAIIHSQNDIINPVFNVTENPMGVSSDFKERILTSSDEFLSYSAEIRRLASKYNIHVFEFIPPSALDKKPLTSDEKAILIGYASHKSYDWTLPSRLLNSTFDRIASILKLVDRVNGEYTFVDGRRAFEGETGTMFADIWHFGDAGHYKFGALISNTTSYWFKNKPDQY